MKITIRTGPVRKKPMDGDEKVVKGVTFIRQQKIIFGHYEVRNGKPVFEWVEKFGPRDRRVRR